MSEPESSALAADPSPAGLPFPITLTLLPTYRCSAACDNCCFASNPDVRERAPQDRLLSYIDEAVETFSTLQVCVISGGEPFMLGDDLAELIAGAAGHGLHVRIVTNAFWAADKDRARRRLGRLVEAGLSELNVSSGDAHAKFVAIDRVVNALEAGVHHGISSLLVVENTARSRILRERFLAHPVLRRAARRHNGADLLRVIDTAWMQNYDGAVEPVREARLNRENLELRKPCDSVFSTIVISPSERLGLCCGLTREQIPELRGHRLTERRMGDIVAEGSGDLMLIWLMIEGPERILAWAAERNPAIEWENLYAHHCDACRRIFHDPDVRSTIAKHAHEKMPELLLRYTMMRRGQIPAPAGGRSTA